MKRSRYVQYLKKRSCDGNITRDRNRRSTDKVELGERWVIAEELGDALAAIIANFTSYIIK